MPQAKWEAVDRRPLRNDRPEVPCEDQIRRRLPGESRARHGALPFHGGLSTGPRTDEGRARISEVQRRRWRAYRASKLKKACLPLDRLGVPGGCEKTAYRW